MDEYERRRGEVKEGRIQLQDVLTLYHIELIETRASLLAAIRTNNTAPKYFIDFFHAFSRFFGLCQSILDDGELKERIQIWFKVAGTSKRDKEIGMELSSALQKVVEDKGFFPFFKKLPLTPPYLVKNERG